MHTINPFHSMTPQRSVDEILGQSYYVVKEVYLHLDIIKKVTEDDSIQWLFKEWNQVNKLLDLGPQLKTVVENLDSILMVPKRLQELQEKTQESLDSLSTTLQTDLGILSATTEEYLKNLLDETNKQVESCKNYAEKAGFSYRFVPAELKSFAVISSTAVVPNTYLKVGDHVVDTIGNVFAIESISGSLISLGKWLCTYQGDKGDKGDPGTGLSLTGEFDTLDEFKAANLQGKSGDAYVIKETVVGSSDESTQNHIYIWDTNTDQWKDVGKLQGQKGDTGLSANEILMNPDPTEYFIEIYGSTTTDVVNTLVVNQSVISPEPVETYEDALDDGVVNQSNG